jgi:metacaspase-1
MAKGYSLHIGLNAVDPNHYNGWDGQLNACEADALSMAEIAASQGFETTILLTNQATRATFESQMQQFADKIQEGDIFLLTYSGHGGQIPDLNYDENDEEDETWCLFDSEIIDDEIYAMYCAFKSKVRILVFSDSCHSGTVTKLAAFKALGVTLSNEPRPVFRNTPLEVRHLPKKQSFL